jgi:hypothetical protein
VNTLHRIQSHNKRRYQADCTAWIRTIAGVQDQPEENALAIIVKVRTAYELLRTGQGSNADFDRVACAMNVALARAELIDPLCEQTMVEGIRAMYGCAAIHERHGTYGFTGPGLLASGEAIDLYEDILRKSSPKQMDDAANSAHVRVTRLMREGVQ